VSQELRGLYKLGGASVIASGVLFLSKYRLELVASPPPSSGVEILPWVRSGKHALGFGKELRLSAAWFVAVGVKLYRVRE